MPLYLRVKGAEWEEVGLQNLECTQMDSFRYTLQYFHKLLSTKNKLMVTKRIMHEGISERGDGD